MKEEFRDRYVESLKEKVETIKLLETKFLEGNAFADQNLRNLAHALHGSGSTFGFPTITRASAVVEQANEDEVLIRALELKVVLEKIIAGYAVASRARVATKTDHPKIEKAEGEKLVLVIENSEETCNQIAQCLQQQSLNIKTVLARDALDAEEQLLRGDYDLVILDLVLPDKDGRQILQEIKIFFQMALPVIVLSGVDKDAVRIDCVGLGADKYLTKPFESSELSADIRELLAGEEKQTLGLVPLDDDKTTESKALAGQTILVADDDEHVGLLITHLMTEQGANVEYASNGREAIHKLRTTSPALAILDLKMPEMDGFEVLEEIRQDQDLKSLPVIMLIALGGEDDILRGYNMGANDYIIKPLSEAYLTARVKSLLNTNPE